MVSEEESLAQTSGRRLGDGDWGWGLAFGIATFLHWSFQFNQSGDRTPKLSFYGKATVVAIVMTLFMAWIVLAISIRLSVP